MNTPRYDPLAPRYDASMGRLERWFLARWRQQLFAELPTCGQLLEIGAGTGANLSLYSDGVQLVATELSGEMIRIASAKHQHAGVSFVQNAAEALPFRDQSFDAAIATLVFCSVNSPGAAFAELRRVVKPGGKILLLDHVRPPGVLGPIFDLLNLFTALCGDQFNRRTADAARAAGFTVDRIDVKAQGIFNLIVLRNK